MDTGVFDDDRYWVIEVVHAKADPHDLEWLVAAAPDGAVPDLLFCDNDTNTSRLYGSPDSPAYPKDGINDHVRAGASTVNPGRTVTKVAAWYRLTVAPGETQVVHVRLRPPSSAPAFGPGFDDVLAMRLAESEEFNGEVIPSSASEDERLVGGIWGK